MADQSERVRASLAGRYTIERELGRGGMATVYLARDLKHERLVALKVLRPELAASLGVDRFLREIQVTAHLTHPNILPLLDSGRADDFLYYVTPYVEGESLRDRLNRERQLPLDEALRLATQVAGALDYAHRHRVVHRDIKPENILLEDGQAVVADFGIARALHAAEGGKLTETGLALGTAAYMSPEQATGEQVDGRSDIYSLGCVLYEMLAGTPPHAGPTTQAIITKKVTEEAPSIRRVRADVPPAVDEALRKVLAQNPAARFESAALFAATLQAAPSSGFVGTRRPLRLAVAILAVLALGISTWLLRGSFQKGHSRTERPMLVVLPFENLGLPADEYFADGITEEITGRLAQLSGLGVIARTSATQYKGAHKSIRQIGAELGVNYVLEGSVRWEKPPSGRSRVRVAPQLIRVSDETHVWAQPYDAVLADVFSVQGTIAERVAEALNVSLLGGEQAAVASQPTRDLEAYDLFLRGNAHLSRTYNQSDLDSAAGLYERAVWLDPEFALAYARLSQVHSWMYWRFYDHTDARRARAERAASRALALRPAMPDAHLARGYVHFFGYHDFEPALQEFQAARTLQPSSAEAAMAVGRIERRQGQWDLAMADFQQAVVLNPRDWVAPLELASTQFYQHRYSEALRWFDRASALTNDQSVSYYVRFRSELYLVGSVEGAREAMRRAASRLGVDSMVRALVLTGWWSLVFIDQDYQTALERLALPRNSSAWGPYYPGPYYLAKAELHSRRGETASARVYYDSARVQLEARVREEPRDAINHVDLGIALAGLGLKQDAIREAQTAVNLVPVSRDAFLGSDILHGSAVVYVRAGDYETAIDQLALLLTIPSQVSATILRIDPIWAPLRGNPRFERLAKGS